jgi:hypothetical protein
VSADASRNWTETTLGKFTGQRAGNYSTMPTKDVPILPDIQVCKTCRTRVEHVPHPKGHGWGLGTWQHAEANECTATWIGTADRCRYCHSQDAKYRQHAWYDAVECERCGGVAGYAIGD